MIARPTPLPSPPRQPFAPVTQLQIIHREAEKKNHFSFMNKSFNIHCSLTKFITLIVNEYYHPCNVFNFWNLTNLRTFLGKSMT